MEKHRILLKRILPLTLNITILCIILSTTLNINISYASAMELPSGISDLVNGDISIFQDNESLAPYTHDTFERTSAFLLYNNKKINLYSGPSTSYKILGTLNPQVLIGIKRRGDWFLINTWLGQNWIYLYNNTIEMREIDTLNSDTFTTIENVSVYIQPFSAFWTSENLTPDTYMVYKKSGSWLYTDRGWINSSTGYFPDAKAKLSVTSINGMPIKEKIVKVSTSVRPAYPMKPQYITIHNTSNTSHSANALGHAKLLEKYSITGGNYTSWHYTVDENKAYQSIPLNESAWHAGDSAGPGNRNSIAIEICENGDYEAAENKAALLAAQLLYELNLPISALHGHRDFSGKNCPARIYAKPNGWTNFITKVQTAYNNLNVKSY
jgi:N-acetylmuramoyl-L-alanine amidase